MINKLSKIALSLLLVSSIALGSLSVPIETVSATTHASSHTSSRASSHASSHSSSHTSSRTSSRAATRSNSISKSSANSRSSSVHSSSKSSVISRGSAKNNISNNSVAARNNLKASSSFKGSTFNNKFGSTSATSRSFYSTGFGGGLDPFSFMYHPYTNSFNNYYINSNLFNENKDNKALKDTLVKSKQKTFWIVVSENGKDKSVMVTENQFNSIKPGDKVSVKAGKLYVNGKVTGK